MKKETIIAVSFGILLGVVVAVVMILSTQKKQDAKVIPVVQNNNITPVASQEAKTTAQLQISEPKNETITDKNTVTIKGKTVAGSLIIVQSALGYEIVENEKADFSVDFDLALGENKITVSVYPKDANGAVQEQELLVYYLKQE